MEFQITFNYRIRILCKFQISCKISHVTPPDVSAFRSSENLESIIIKRQVPRLTSGKSEYTIFPHCMNLFCLVWPGPLKQPTWVHIWDMVLECFENWSLVKQNGYNYLYWITSNVVCKEEQRQYQSNTQYSQQLLVVGSTAVVFATRLLAFLCDLFLSLQVLSMSQLYQRE